MEINSTDEHRANSIDSIEKNKFKFEWLEKTVIVKTSPSDSAELKLKVGDEIRKIEVSGKVVCKLCSDNIYYGKRGFSAISDHLKTKKHFSKELAKKKNFVLPSSFFTKPETSKTSNPPPAIVNNEKLVNVPLCDRITNAECLVLGVIAENNLPFTMSPVLIDLSKALANDKKALNHLSMARTTASYKMRLGLSKTLTEETCKNLQDAKFSLNIDEATSNNFKRVLSILVSYFSTTSNRVVVEHLNSLSVTKVTSENLFNNLVKVFEELNIPWINLISVLMDSCNVMRGAKAGLEERIRDKAPHLLDIDGDTCHHIHNASKKFCHPFEGYIEKFLLDVANDFKWSADQKDCLREICLILNIKFTSLINMVSHRWLSCYDASLNNLRIFDALTVLYYAFLSEKEKVQYFPILTAVYQDKCVHKEGRNKIKEIHTYLIKKKYTAEGKARKERISVKIFSNRKKSLLIMHFYTAALPLLKKYVMLFQTKEPQIHKLHDEMEQLFLNFLSCFIKQEALKDKTIKQLLNLDVSAEINMLKRRNMFIGSTTESIIGDDKDATVEDFLKKASQAYSQCAQYLQKKLPLQNPVLKCISAIDPIARGHSIALDRLKTLPKLVKNVLFDQDVNQYALDIHLYQVDKSLPSYLDESGNVLPIDVWWAAVFKMKKYSALEKMVKALLSCFHGPQVESAFSMMGNILDKESSNMKIDTFSSIQTVKYRLLSQKKSAIDFFKKKDHLHDGINRSLSYNMRNSYSLYKKELNEKADEKERKRKALNINKDVTSKLTNKRKLQDLVLKKQLKKAKI